MPRELESRIPAVPLCPAGTWEIVLPMVPQVVLASATIQSDVKAGLEESYSFIMLGPDNEELKWDRMSSREALERPGKGMVYAAWLRIKRLMLHPG